MDSQLDVGRSFLGWAKVAAIFRSVALSSFEMLPLMLFLIARVFGAQMPSRILLGGALALLVLLVRQVVGVRISPLYFGTNVFFVFASFILVLPLPTLSQFFLELGEVGMFLCILLVSLGWHFLHSNGVLDPISAPAKYKFHSWCLLAVISLCPFIATYFKGNESLAGGLPFILIIISEKAIAYLQLRGR